MNEHALSLLLSGVIAGASPIVLAALGETVTEKAGTINLSLDGTILLSAMAAFVVAYETNSLILGFLVGGCCGAIVAAIVAVFSIHLSRSQVAVGFVLTLMARDLAYFLGNTYSRLQGPQVAPLPIPILKEIPFFGALLFNHNIPVYFSILLIGVIWWMLYRTPLGLEIRSVGENPQAAYARGVNPQKIRFFCTIFGGFLTGLSGALFSLSAKPGWGRPQGSEGTGWIALALVIFGGWHPIRAAFGAYLFSFLQVMGIYFQNWFPSIPSQVFQVAPFPIMIFSLLFFAHANQKTESSRGAYRTGLLFRIFSSNPPAALGKPFSASGVI